MSSSSTRAGPSSRQEYHSDSEDDDSVTYQQHEFEAEAESSSAAIAAATAGKPIRGRKGKAGGNGKKGKVFLDDKVS